MARETASKSIDGIADLVVVAPIREGFIDAYENITYETRLRFVAEALHNVRVSAREHESATPFSDTAERILTLLDFRIGVINKDLFQLDAARGLESRRFLFLAATFDGAWEPYMRLIWRPLGYFLDLLFCNCEGYMPAGDNSFADYAAWVRSAQVDSAIFYSTTGLTVRDQIYLRKLEQVQRTLDPRTDPAADLKMARLVMPDPEQHARDFRAVDDNQPKTHELALEALTVLYRLADYYPPDRIDPAGKKGYIPPSDDPLAARNYTYAEGRYLLRAAQSLLAGWDRSTLPPAVRLLNEDRLKWLETEAGIAGDEPRTTDPKFDPSQVQAGILRSPGRPGRAVKHGALLLMTITDGGCDGKDARAFLKDLTAKISFEGGRPPANGLYRTIAFTARGLTRLGLYDYKLERFPKEFRDGMEKRAGLIGDVRENHPRNWQLPARNWPPATTTPVPRPPVDMSEVDFIIQIRHAPAEGEDEAMLQAEIEALAADAAACGVILVAVEQMLTYPEAAAGSAATPQDRAGHFGFRDGISQPNPRYPDGETAERDDVPLGDLLCGYGNSRGDCAPTTMPGRSAFAFNGSFLVIRKIGQRTAAFRTYLDVESKRIAKDYGIAFTADDLAARLLGRARNGDSLIAAGPNGENDFDYATDPTGDACPLPSHVRRTNPRKDFHGRPTPRIARRGMSFGKLFDDAPEEPRGVVFMAYCSSIAEQFEVIQRWINGGNSTDIASAQTDPLLGVRPADGEYIYRFVLDDRVIRTSLPVFTRLLWGLYLFAPSQDALKAICGFTGATPDIDEPLETRGREFVAKFAELPAHVREAEWKRVLEDLDTKDPAERDISPDIWSAIRYFEGGSYRIPRESGKSGASAADGGTGTPSIVLVGSASHVNEVLRRPDIFSVEEQERRIHGTSGDIYVAMQPGPRYDRESAATNEIMFAQSEEMGFRTGYDCGAMVLDQAVQLALKGKRLHFKLELRRDFLMPTLGAICAEWFGLPDGVPGDAAITPLMDLAGWSWDDAPGRRARCPGDFLAPSRHAFYPRPAAAVEDYARDHGPRIRKAGLAFVERYRGKGAMPGYLTRLMEERIPDDDVLARNIIGMMIGALPPADGNLRGILHEWITEGTLWRHQAALRRAAEDGRATYCAAAKALKEPMSRAICKRPAPDLLYRVALSDHVLRAGGERRAKDVLVRKGDLVVIGLVSATQWSLQDPKKPDGDLAIAFGGERKGARQSSHDSFHACPAQKMMTGTMMGMLAALLDVGRIRAMPSSLIVQISDWAQPG